MATPPAPPPADITPPLGYSHSHGMHDGRAAGAAPGASSGRYHRGLFDIPAADDVTTPDSSAAADRDSPEAMAPTPPPPQSTDIIGGGLLLENIEESSGRSSQYADSSLLLRPHGVPPLLDDSSPPPPIEHIAYLSETGSSGDGASSSSVSSEDGYTSSNASSNLNSSFDDAIRFPPGAQLARLVQRPIPVQYAITEVEDDNDGGEKDKGKGKEADATALQWGITPVVSFDSSAVKGNDDNDGAAGDANKATATTTEAAVRAMSPVMMAHAAFAAGAQEDSNPWGTTAADNLQTETNVSSESDDVAPETAGKQQKVVAATDKVGAMMSPVMMAHAAFAASTPKEAHDAFAAGTQESHWGTNLQQQQTDSSNNNTSTETEDTNVLPCEEVGEDEKAVNVSGLTDADDEDGSNYVVDNNYEHDGGDDEVGMEDVNLTEATGDDSEENEHSLYDDEGRKLPSPKMEPQETPPQQPSPSSSVSAATPISSAKSNNRPLLQVSASRLLLQIQERRHAALKESGNSLSARFFARAVRKASRNRGVAAGAKEGADDSAKNKGNKVELGPSLAAAAAESPWNSSDSEEGNSSKGEEVQRDDHAKGSLDHTGDDDHAEEEADDDPAPNLILSASISSNDSGLAGLMTGAKAERTQSDTKTTDHSQLNSTYVEQCEWLETSSEEDNDDSSKTPTGVPSASSSISSNAGSAPAYEVYATDEEDEGEGELVVAASEQVDAIPLTKTTSMQSFKSSMTDDSEPLLRATTGANERWQDDTIVENEENQGEKQMARLPHSAEDVTATTEMLRQVIADIAAEGSSHDDKSNQDSTSVSEPSQPTSFTNDNALSVPDALVSADIVSAATESTPEKTPEVFSATSRVIDDPGEDASAPENGTSANDELSASAGSRLWGQSVRHGIPTAAVAVGAAGAVSVAATTAAPPLPPPQDTPTTAAAVTVAATGTAPPPPPAQDTPSTDPARRPVTPSQPRDQGISVAQASPTSSSLGLLINSLRTAATKPVVETEGEDAEEHELLSVAEHDYEGPECSSSSSADEDTEGEDSGEKDNGSALVEEAQSKASTSKLGGASSYIEDAPALELSASDVPAPDDEAQSKVSVPTRNDESILRSEGAGMYKGVEGVPSGQASMIFADGTRYSGGWQNGNPSGEGVFILPNGQKRYGSWDGSTFEQVLRGGHVVVGDKDSSYADVDGDKDTSSSESYADDDKNSIEPDADDDKDINGPEAYSYADDDKDSYSSESDADDELSSHDIAKLDTSARPKPRAIDPSGMDEAEASLRSGTVELSNQEQDDVDLEASIPESSKDPEGFEATEAMEAAPDADSEDFHGDPSFASSESDLERGETVPGKVQSDRKRTRKERFLSFVPFLLVFFGAAMLGGGIYIWYRFLGPGGKGTEQTATSVVSTDTDYSAEVIYEDSFAGPPTSPADDANFVVEDEFDGPRGRTQPIALGDEIDDGSYDVAESPTPAPTIDLN